jgi:hypothetical protein
MKSLKLSQWGVPLRFSPIFSVINKPASDVSKMGYFVFRRKEAGIYLQCNIAARWCNNCCSEKAVSITYSKYVFVALGIQHSMRVSYVLICGNPALHHSFTYVITGTGARCWWRSWLRHCATSRKMSGSIPDVVIGIFH